MAMVALAAAALSAASSYAQSENAKNTANYNAAVGETNKAFALTDQQRQADLARGRTIAAYGAAGVGGGGSPMDVLADSAQQSALDRLKIKYNYDSRINLDRSQANAYGSSALLNATAAGMRGYATAIPMFGGTSSGAGPVNNSYGGYKDLGYGTYGE